MLGMILFELLCRCPHRPHYGPCLSVCLSVHSSHVGSKLKSKKAYKNQNWCERFPGRISQYANFQFTKSPNISAQGAHIFRIFGLILLTVCSGVDTADEGAARSFWHSEYEDGSPACDVYVHSPAGHALQAA